MEVKKAWKADNSRWLAAPDRRDRTTNEKKEEED